MIPQLCWMHLAMNAYGPLQSLISGGLRAGTQSASDPPRAPGATRRIIMPSPEDEARAELAELLAGWNALLGLIEEGHPGLAWMKGDVDAAARLTRSLIHSMADPALQLRPTRLTEVRAP
ncbi:MAG TPA: hypothetical protein VF618_21940 [Thermoanaerobaculia bacterium]